MSGTAETITFPEHPLAGELFSPRNGRVYQWRNEWLDVTHVFVTAMPTVGEPPDDGSIYVRVRKPGARTGVWMRLPAPDTTMLLSRDGRRPMTGLLALADAAAGPGHAVNRTYVDKQVAMLLGEIQRLKSMLAPKPPRDLVGEARGRTYSGAAG